MDSTTDAVFHASAYDYLGEEFVFDDGGFYEKVVDGDPQHREESRHMMQVSDIPQLAASKTPEAAILAQVLNIGWETNHWEPKRQTEIHVYRIESTPDMDLTSVNVGEDKHIDYTDFCLLEEVRFNNPSENPVKGTHHCTTKIGHEITDAVYINLPYGKFVLSEWGEAVKQGIRHKLDTGSYPTPISEFANVDPPNIESHRSVKPPIDSVESQNQ